MIEVSTLGANDHNLNYSTELVPMDHEARAYTCPVRKSIHLHSESYDELTDEFFDRQLNEPLFAESAAFKACVRELYNQDIYQYEGQRDKSFYSNIRPLRTKDDISGRASPASILKSVDNVYAGRRKLRDSSLPLGYARSHNYNDCTIKNPLSMEKLGVSLVPTEINSRSTITDMYTPPSSHRTDYDSPGLSRTMPGYHAQFSPVADQFEAKQLHFSQGNSQFCDYPRKTRQNPSIPIPVPTQITASSPFLGIYVVRQTVHRLA